MQENLKIAIDFDGTIVTDEYPKIGKELPFAFHTLKTIQKKGNLLILWTRRFGKELDEAVEYCKTNEIEFYSINKNYPEEKIDDFGSRKILADIYIDKDNLGGIVSWPEIYQIIYPEKSDNEKPGFLSRLKRWLFRKNQIKRTSLLFARKGKPNIIAR